MDDLLEMGMVVTVDDNKGNRYTRTIVHMDGVYFWLDGLLEAFERNQVVVINNEG